MTQQEYFGDWYPYLNMRALNTALQYSCKGPFYPIPQNVFRAFTLCSARDTTVVFLGQDPYPQKDVATGIAFANDASTPEERLSPSLQVLKEAAIDYTKPHGPIEFDNTLESWGKQGVLLLNSALTVKPGTPGSHALYWREFISSFLLKFSSLNPSVLFVLFGKQAQGFKSSIKAANIIEVEHPASLARTKSKLPQDLFPTISRYVFGLTGEKIQWFNELD